jgi:hypothetical protein
MEFPRTGRDIAGSVAIDNLFRCEGKPWAMPDWQEKDPGPGALLNEG